LTWPARGAGCFHAAKVRRLPRGFCASGWSIGQYIYRPAATRCRTALRFFEMHKDCILGSETETSIARFVVNNSDGNMYRLESEKALLIYTSAEKAAEQIEYFRSKSNVTAAKIGAIQEMDPKEFIEFLDKHRVDYPNLYVDTLANRNVDERLTTAKYLQEFKQQCKKAGS
jgi:hypothetical protein